MESDKLSALIAAADAGSLSRAATQLGVQLSTLSRQIADLEGTLGVPLLIRTGRGVRVTPAGERYVERARGIIRELAAAAVEARGERGAAMSQLRLSAPVELSLRLLPGVLAALLARHPGLVIDAHSDAQRVSLLEEDYDAAIRLGPLKDSELLARRLGQVSLVLAARPATASKIGGVAALRAAEFVLVAGTRTELVTLSGGRKVALTLRGRCRVATFTEAAGLAAASEYLAVLPSFTAAEPIAAGQLARVLPRLELPRVDLHLVYPARRRGAPVLEELAALLAEALARVESALAGR